MELNDIMNSPRSEKLNELLGSRFGFDFDLEKIDEDIARKMIISANERMKKIASKNTNYEIDRNYMENKLVKETIEALQIERKYKLYETDDFKLGTGGPLKNPMRTSMPSHSAKKDDEKSNGITTSAGADSRRNHALRILAGQENYAKARRAIELMRDGQSVPPTIMRGFLPVLDMITDIMSSNLSNVNSFRVIDKRAKKQLGFAESIRQRSLKRLLENTTDNAELILASKDMVDSIQAMLAAVSKMKAENLYPLGDSIREKMSPEVAQSFLRTAEETLDELIRGVTAAREGMTAASDILTGTGSVDGVDLTQTELPFDDMGGMDGGPEQMDLPLDDGPDSGGRMGKGRPGDMPGMGGKGPDGGKRPNLDINKRGGNIDKINFDVASGEAGQQGSAELDRDER